MDMANIYALPEFEPIIHQFQLGNLINVAIRSDYVKRARLLQVDFNFDDFSDFSCEFGELTNLRTPSSIHADLLASALTAGKSVASNASYWDKGSDVATSLSLLIQQGLLDAATVIKAIDGNQGVSIDNRGIHLQKFDPSTGALDPKEGWIVNNQFLYSDDNFKTAKSVFGEYVIDGQTKWGLLAEAVMAGYVAGCTIEGGVIRIGEQPDGTYAFEVHEDGSVTMGGGNTIAGYAKEETVTTINSQVNSIQQAVDDINSSRMYRVEIISSGPTAITSTSNTSLLTCKVYSWDTDITDTIDASFFNWKRISGLAEQDEIWNAMPEHQHVKSIEISASDVPDGVSASFTCEVELPG